jgi:hypothetical protein
MMYRSLRLHLLFVVALCFVACREQPTQQTQAPAAETASLTKDFYAWCIVPFDSVERSPSERIDMLKTLGIRRYAYDWREKNLPEVGQEIELARANDIDMMAVWMWIDANSDQPGKLSAGNEQIFQNLKEHALATEIWVGFNANYFEGKTEPEAIKAGAEMVRYLYDRAQESGSRVALYNHGDWFGEPANQVKVIEALPGLDIGIIYNFHHAHEQIDRFPEIVSVMLPYLWSVNLNGMRREGPKILPLGTGNLEAGMIRTLQKAGYQGPYGILGHVEDRDVQKVLEENLAGLKQLQAQL